MRRTRCDRRGRFAFPSPPTITPAALRWPIRDRVSRPTYVSASSHPSSRRKRGHRPRLVDGETTYRSPSRPNERGMPAGWWHDRHDRAATLTRQLVPGMVRTRTRRERAGGQRRESRLRQAHGWTLSKPEAAASTAIVTWRTNAKGMGPRSNPVRSPVRGPFGVAVLASPSGGRLMLRSRAFSRRIDT